MKKYISLSRCEHRVANTEARSKEQVFSDYFVLDIPRNCVNSVYYVQ